MGSVSKCEAATISFLIEGLCLSYTKMIETVRGSFALIRVFKFTVANRVQTASYSDAHPRYSN